jgi:hypothetical protein
MMIKFLFFVCVLFNPLNIVFAQAASETYLTKDSVYIRAIEYYDESEDSSTVIEITYPKLWGMEEETIEIKINSFLEEEFLKSIEWYEEFIAVQDSFPSIEYEAGMFFSFETGFDIKLLNESYLSLVLNHYEFTGGAHGNFYSMGYTFDLKSGDLITLDEIIKANSIPEITKLCERKLLEMYESPSISETGIFEDYIELTVEQDFHLLPNALVFQFDPYEIAPYSMGNIEIILPYEEINNYLIKDFDLKE